MLNLELLLWRTRPLSQSRTRGPGRGCWPRSSVHQHSKGSAVNSERGLEQVKSKEMSNFEIFPNFEFFEIFHFLANIFLKSWCARLIFFIQFSSTNKMKSKSNILALNLIQQNIALDVWCFSTSFSRYFWDEWNPWLLSISSV